jgi:hypothetical protein
VFHQNPLRYPNLKKLSILVSVVSFLVLFVSTGAADRWENFQGGRWRPLSVDISAGQRFTLQDSRATGVAFTNHLSEIRGATNRTLFNGSGVATGDVDGDGLADIVFAGVESQLVVLRNIGGLKFTNVTAASGIKPTNLHYRGVALADLDGDSALDLLVTANNSGVLCWRNDGRGRFTEVTRESGTASAFGSMTMALGDIDGNGTLDLYVANNRSDDIRDQGEVRLSMVGGRRSVPAPLRNRLVLFGEELLEYGEPDALLLNDGTGRFRPANWNLFQDESGQPLPGAPLDWGLSAAFRDLNGDLAPDLYVCNDFWTPDRIWFNDGTGKFRAAPPLAFRQTSASSMGVDTADLNFDGSPEIFVLDMLSRSPAARKRQMDAQKSFPSLPGILTDRPQSLRNTLFLARGDGTFAEIANFAGLVAAEWAWQPIFIDADLDGHPDLLITSGHVRDVQDRDANLLIRGRQRNYQSITNRDERHRAFIADVQANSRLYPPLKTPVLAFRNQGELSFHDVTDQWGTDLPGVHHGIATADFDGDGDLDFVVNSLDHPATLYRNDFSAPRIAVRLRGKKPNTQAIGAMVILRGGPTPFQRHEVTSGGRYLSGSDPLLVFAAGTNRTKMQLEITWRNGRTRIVPDVQANRYYEIQEHDPLDQPRKLVTKIPTKKWFEDVTTRLGHTHHETLFDDFSRQPLLPHRLSQFGPGVAWVDLDRDGWEDLVIGTGAGGFLGAFRNNQLGGFSRWTNAPFHQALHRDTTTLLNIPSPEGKTSLIVGLASYEDGRTNTASLFRYDVAEGTRVAAWPGLPGSVGAISAADMDGDNDLDLFVGSRVLPGRWPRGGHSLLLEKNAGNWNARPLSSGTNASNHPISAAIWSDLDSDGFPELITAGEFSPIQILKNNRGNLESSNWMLQHPDGKQSPLHEMKGWWTALTAGDFDGDGLLDIVAGNWGLNSHYSASPSRPLKLYAGSFPPSAYFAVIETIFDPQFNAYAPARPLDDFYADLPFLTGKFRTFREYSESSIETVLGEQKSLAAEYSIDTLATVVLLNRKNHFQLLPLPMEAQFAPAFGLNVSDFDLDGREDLFIAQNFFAMRTGVPRLDAGRGLLLKGDGQGGFTPLSAQESGIEIYGEQRGSAVADFDNDGKPDLVVTQNGSATRLYHNNIAATPSLRLRITGPPENRDGIGCIIRIKNEDRFGPAHEIRAGSGYWSQDSSVIVLPLPQVDSKPNELQVIWPGGRTRLIQLPSDINNINVSWN